MAITVSARTLPSEDTFRTRALLSAAIALLFAPHAPMKSSAASDAPAIFLSGLP